MTDQNSSDRDSRHKNRMERKKAVVDAAIAAATDTRGLLLVNTGNGKGKSSAAFGVLARALGHGMQAGVVQFVKGRSDTGEEAFFRRQPEVSWHVMGDGFTWDTQDRSADMASARAGWEQARAFLRDPAIGLVVLDELNIVLKYAYLDVQEVIADLQARPPLQHVIITGRGAPEALVEAADTVTDMGMVKHAFKAGIAAQPGVEF
ncbi:cob(I)yrinic acid a,c-diamide adenosyltransferase [Zoogloea dura]|jgi:cob(I)alamin adenosyltransferase|uniref:Corrinoid adenosyltransferase n=1 Tax=Zoogloea dura TaxID=2728840 RepID=A0A848G6J4_9RHOO|nr:cob(I)yrinic acid a,c-diamide adenosyltransferase [Zoogloea dura]NML25261.1 cob(I)yrinic acid a,c-diamide adenosyltransferase [Zoogloea dura]